MKLIMEGWRKFRDKVEEQLTPMGREESEKMMDAEERASKDPMASMGRAREASMYNKAMPEEWQKEEYDTAMRSVVRKREGSPEEREKYKEELRAQPKMNAEEAVVLRRAFARLEDREKQEFVRIRKDNPGFAEAFRKKSLEEKLEFLVDLPSYTSEKMVDRELESRQ